MAISHSLDGGAGFLGSPVFVSCSRYSIYVLQYCIYGTSLHYGKLMWAVCFNLLAPAVV